MGTLLFGAMMLAGWIHKAHLLEQCLVNVNVRPCYMGILLLPEVPHSNKLSGTVHAVGPQTSL